MLTGSGIFYSFINLYIHSLFHGHSLHSNYLQSSMLAIDDSTLNQNPVPVLKEFKIQYEKHIHEQNIVKSWQP